MNSARQSSFSDDELMRYARQIILKGWDIEAQRRLSQSSVTLIGAGGLGCPISQSLVRAGIGRINLIDHDQIEVTNLARQSLFFDEHVGQSKALVAASQLKKHNPHTDVRGFCAEAQQVLDSDSSDDLRDNLSHDQRRDLNQDLIIDASDNFRTRDWLNQWSFTHQKTLLSVSAIGFDGQMLLLHPAAKTGCYRCVFGEGGQDVRCSELGVLSTTTQVMGALAANSALMWLGLDQSLPDNQLLIWSAKSLSTRLIRYAPDQACPVCGLSRGTASDAPPDAT